MQWHYNVHRQCSITFSQAQQQSNAPSLASAGVYGKDAGDMSTFVRLHVMNNKLHTRDDHHHP